jgi:hypothetical protein
MSSTMRSPAEEAIAPAEFLLTDVGGDRGARTLEMNAGAEGHRSLLASLIISCARPGSQLWFRYFRATASAANLMRAAASMSNPRAAHQPANSFGSR